MSMDDIPPEVLEQLIDQYMAEQGAPMTGEQSNFYGAMPMYDLEDDPYTLNQQLNQLQDVNQLMADPVFQGLGGPGAFSQQAFQPRVSMEVVDSPEYVRWQNYLNTPDSFEGMVAAELEGGGTPYSAIRKIRAKALENPEGALATELQALFPIMDEAGAVPGEINWQEISGAATSIDELRGQIPQLGNAGFTMEDGTVVAGAGEIMEVIGPDGRPQLIRRTETPSPMQEKYDELGIPNPFEQYTPEGIMGPEWQSGDEMFQGGQADIDALTQASQQAYQEYLAAQRAQTRPAGTANVGAAPEPEAAAPRQQVEAEPMGEVMITSPITGTPTAAAVDRPPEGASPLLLEGLSQGPLELTDWLRVNRTKLTADELDDIADQVVQLSSTGDPMWSGTWTEIEDMVGENIPDSEHPGGNRWWQQWFQGGGSDDTTGREGVLGGAPAEAGGGQVISAEQTAAAEAAGPSVQSGIPQPGTPAFEDYMNEVYPNLSREDRQAANRQIAQMEADAGALPAGGAGVGIHGAEVFGLPAGAKPTPRRKPTEGEPVPPPGDLTMEPNEADQWFGATSDQRGVAPNATQSVMEDWLRQQTPPYVYGGGYTPQYANRQEFELAQGGRQYANRQEWEAAQGGRPPSEPPHPASTWPPTLVYDPWQQARGDVAPPRPGAYAPPSGGYATLEEAAAAGSTAAQRYLEENGPTPQGSSEYQAPPGGYPTLEQAAAAGSPIAQRYLEENGPTPPPPRRPRHPEAPLGGAQYEAMLNQQLANRPGEPPRDVVREAVAASGGLTPPRDVQREAAAATEAMLRRQLRTGEAEYDPLSSAGTGERVRRTDEERRELAERNAPQGLQGEEYDVLGGDRTPAGAAKAKWMSAYRRRSHGLVARQAQREQLYGADFGRAVAAAMRAQQAGASPMQQAYAQRMQNIQRAGIPLGARPQILEY